MAEAPKIPERTYFPIRILVDEHRGEPAHELICDEPEHIPNGIVFKVLETNVVK